MYTLNIAFVLFFSPFVSNLFFLLFCASVPLCLIFFLHFNDFFPYFDSCPPSVLLSGETVMKKSLYFLLFFLVFSLSLPGSGIELTQRYISPRGIIVFLPEDWKAVPQDSLHQDYLVFSRSDSLGKRRMFDCLFQPAYFRNLFTSPSIAVTIDWGKGYSEEMGKKAKEIDRQIKAGITAENDPLLSSYIGAMHEYVYDDSLRLLRFVSETNGEEYGFEGKALIQSAFFFADNGFIEVACMAYAEDFDSYRPLFDAVIENMRLPPQFTFLEGRSPISGQGSPHSTIAIALITTITGMVLGGLIVFLIMGAKSRRVV
jgi:hypothetical protein